MHASAYEWKGQLEGLTNIPTSELFFSVKASGQHSILTSYGIQQL